VLRNSDGFTPFGTLNTGGYGNTCIAIYCFPIVPPLGKITDSCYKQPTVEFCWSLPDRTALTVHNKYLLCGCHKILLYKSGS